MGRITAAARQVRWYWGGSLMGDNHYQRYLEHRRRTHPPDQPMLSERDYWRMRHAASDANPGGARCC